LPELSPARPTVRPPRFVALNLALRARLSLHPRLPRFEPVFDELAILGLSPDLRPDPYPDYARRFTAEGGVELIFKDLDQSWAITLRACALWILAMGPTLIYALTRSPLEGVWNGVSIVAAAIVYGVIVAKPVEFYRSLEIRPDCMIIDRADVFWKAFMDFGWPSFQPKEENVQVLAGVYGTRWVEYLTLRRFDENDRTPEVLTTHLQAAITQLWDHPQKGV
jgi:hypothetical protein